MDIELWKNIIIDQKQELNEILNISEIIKRDFPINEIKKSLNYPNIVAILGVRRAGKSTLARFTSKKLKILAINFDDERLISLKAENLNDILIASQQLFGDIEFFLFDEIQNISGWELFVNRLRRTKKVIITGSNANLLSGELSTHLTGRYIHFVLLPFSFKEVLQLKKFDIMNETSRSKLVYSTSGKAKIIKELDEYMIKGGFPEYYKFGKMIVRNIYSNIIEKDIIIRHRIKKINEFKDIARYLIGNFANLFTYTKLKKTFAIQDIHTIKKYIDYLQEAYIIFTIEKFSFKLKTQILSPKKIYAIDNGIIDVISTRITKDRGRLMENLVAIELLRRKLYWNRIDQICYWSDYNNHEIDFVLLKSGKIVQLIQVCEIHDEKNIPDREVDNLLKASSELGCNKILIISWTYEAKKEYKGKIIHFLPLWKWIFNKSNRTNND